MCERWRQHEQQPASRKHAGEGGDAAVRAASCFKLKAPPSGPGVERGCCCSCCRCTGGIIAGPSSIQRIASPPLRRRPAAAPGASTRPGTGVLAPGARQRAELGAGSWELALGGRLGASKKAEGRAQRQNDKPKLYYCSDSDDKPLALRRLLPLLPALLAAFFVLVLPW